MKVGQPFGLNNGLRQLIIDPRSFPASPFTANDLAASPCSPLLRPTWSQLLAWQLALSALTETKFSIRTVRAKMGLFGTPAAKDIQPLLAAAALEWAAISDPIEQAMFAGLSILLIHPLTDGNGRLARWVWFDQLGAAGWDAQMRCNMLVTVFSQQRDALIAAVAMARRGQPQPVYRLLSGPVSGSSTFPE